MARHQILVLGIEVRILVAQQTQKVICIIVRIKYRRNLLLEAVVVKVGLSHQLEIGLYAGVAPEVACSNHASFANIFQ